MHKHIIEPLTEQNVTIFWCDARKTAVGIYKKFNMSIEGNEFMKSNMPYFRVSVNLNWPKSVLNTHNKSEEFDSVVFIAVIKVLYF